jgi:hypothetical protein
MVVMQASEHWQRDDPPDGGRLGRHGRFLAKPLVRTRGVVVAHILEDDALKLPAVQHQDVVETLAP